MKVERKEDKKFIPVVLTLESQEEVDYLCSLVGTVYGYGKVREFVGDAYMQLKDHIKYCGFFIGTISCKDL